MVRSVPSSSSSIALTNTTWDARSPFRTFAPHSFACWNIAQKGLGKSLTFAAHILDVAKREELPDIFLYDPKRGTINTVRKELEANGYWVGVLDISNPDASELRFDPMTMLDVTRVYDIDRQIDGLVDLLCPLSTSHSRNEHFEEYPRIMLAGVIKFKLLTGKATLRDCVLTLIDDRERDRAFKLMKQMRHEPLIAGAVSVWDSVGDKEKGSFISSNFRKLKVWLRPSVDRMTRANVGEETSISWTWEKAFRDKRPLCVCIITGLSTEDGELARLFIGCLVIAARQYFDQYGPLPKGLQIIIDEAKTLGVCSPLVEVNRTLREARVILLMCWLSLHDMKSVYSDYTTLLGGCDVIAFGNSGDTEFYEYVSKRLGQTTVMTRSKSENETSEGKGEHEHQRPLILQSDIGMLPFEEFVASLRSKNGLLNVKGKKPFIIAEGKPVKWL